MTDNFGPFDGTPWAQDQWYRHAAKWAPSGVNGSPASATTSGDLPLSLSGLNFTIGVGRAWVRGAGFERTGSPASQSIAANTNASLSRRDRVVLRRDLSAKTVAPVLIQGTPSASPTAPALQRSETVQWDLPLFSFLVPPNSGTSISGVVDERAWVDPSNPGPVGVYDTSLGAGNGALTALSGSGDLVSGADVYEASSAHRMLWNGTSWGWPKGPQGELGYAERNTQAGGVASGAGSVDISGTGVSITIPSTRKVRAVCTGQLVSNTAGTIVSLFLVNTTSGKTKGGSHVIVQANVGEEITMVLRESLAAGTYSYKLQLASGGPGDAFTTSEALTVSVEDIGGV